MKQVIILLLILQVTFICSSQTTTPTDLHFNRLSIKNGLPEGVIVETLQDKEGYMWIATQAGLVRYDGYTAKIYQFGIEDPLYCSISCLYEDRSGELWVGTLYQGLYHYNRATDTFIQFKHSPKDSNSLSTDNVVSIFDDRNGNLWLLLADNLDFVGRHIDFFNVKKNQFKRYDILEKNGLYTNATGLINLLEDSRGHIWVGTNNGIFEHIPGSDKFILHFSSTDVNQQKTFGWPTEDAAHPGIIWMNVRDTKANKPEGLLQYNTANNTNKIYRHIHNDSTSLETDSVYTIYKDSKGSLLFGTENGLSVLDTSSKGFINYIIKDKKIRPYDNEIWLLEEDKSGNFWCGNGFNLFLFDTKTKIFTHNLPSEKDPDALPINGYTYLLTDRSGALWVGTVPQGLYWVNKNRSKFTVYKNEPGEPHYFPGGGSVSFAEDKDGTFWLWSKNGLYHWYASSDSFVLIKQLKNRLGQDNPWRISAILIDREGLVWCTTYGTGLFCYNPKTGVLKNFKSNNKDSTSLSLDYINTLFEDDKSTLWIGTHGGGLCSFNSQTGKFKRYPFTQYSNKSPNNHTLNDAVIYTICEDKRGMLWLGTNLDGVNKFDRDSATFTSYLNQGPGTTITKIFEDSKEHLWVGTHASGLFLLDRRTDTFKKFSEKDGLTYNGVLSINEDKSNNLWITSDRGISILNMQTNKISRLSTNNGLPEEPGNINFFKTSDGKFLMPCTDGFISFNPEQLKPDSVSPIVHIESVNFARETTPGNKEVDSFIYRYGKKDIKLHYKENRITFNYIGLQYQNSQLNQYAYKLDGSDKDWIQAGVQRNATYNNLSPGNYTFHVKAANADGVWSKVDDSIIIIIAPPWWLSWWAYCVYILALGSVIYILYRNRINQLNKKQQAQINVMVAAQEGERKRISRDLHDDVGTKLSAIKMFLSSLNEKATGTNNQEIKSLAESSEQFITEVTQDVRRLLLNLSPAVLEEFGYATAVEGLINKINETKQIHFNLVMFGMKQRLPKDYELALYRLTQELINNVLKHAEAKNVSLQIGQRDKKIILMIEDDGKGFDVNAHKDGYGLHNLEARTKLMQGTMTIDSKPGKGTSVWIEIPDNFNAA